MKDNFNALTSHGNISIKNILTIALFGTIIISSTFANGLFFSQAMATGNSTGNSTGNGTPSTTLDNTSTTITSNQNTISAGAQVTFVATVIDSSSSSATPAGSIMWNDGNGGGSFSSAFCDLSSGTCSISYTSSSNTQSSITITATYSGDATHQTSSGTLPLTILTIHTTSVAITPNSASFVPGNAITFTSTVSDTSNSPTTPSGTVSWSDGGAGGSFSSSSCTLSSGTCTTSYTPSSSSSAPNSITITSTYSGDGTHQTNSGTSQISKSNQDTSSVLVTSSSSTISSGGQVTVTATVTDTSNSQNIPTGTITWSDGNIGGILSSPSCNLSSGVCNITYTAPSNIQNSITITASYSGDNVHTTNSGTFVLTSSLLAPTSVTVSPNPASYVSGNTLTFTATVMDTSNSQNIPTGAVTWSDGNTGGVFGTSSCTLTSGTCTTSYTPATNSPESITITATYGGDGIHQTNAGTSALTINSIHATTLAITPNPASVSPGGSITFTATVTDSSSSPITPTSSVSWSDGNGGGVFDQTSCTLTSGACTVSYTPATNPPNAVTITASYNGDNSHQASTGSSQLTTNVLHTTTASITPNPGTFTAGTPITFTVTISDTSEPTSVMIGIVKWTDNGAGGSFSPDACIISNNHCSLDYTPPSNPSGSITITASYAGDSTHSASSATSSVSTNTVTSSPPTSQSNTTPPESATQSPPTQPAPVTQPNTSPPTTQQATKPTTPTTQSNTSPTTQAANTSPSTTTQSTTQSSTHPITQTDSKNPTTTTNTNTSHPQVNPLATISQAISKAVSELESLFQKL